MWHYRRPHFPSTKWSVREKLQLTGVVFLVLLLLYGIYVSTVQFFDQCADAGYSEFECRMMMQSKHVVVMPDHSTRTVIIPSDDE